MLTLLLLTAGIAAQPVQAPANGPPVSTGTLRSVFKMTPEEWRTVEAGGVVARQLERTDDREVVVAGLIRASADSACFLTAFEDIETFKRSPQVTRIRKLSHPPQLTDLKELTWDEKDAADLRPCQAGDCAAKLPPGVVERLPAIRNIADIRIPFQALFREHLFRYIQSYLAKGNAALVEYRDKPKPVQLAREFQQVLDAPPGLRQLAPEFHGYMSGYPSRELAGLKDFFYWSTETFGLRPVTSVTHVSTYRRPGYALIATKQIYATHYFDASLGLTLLVDARVDGRNALYIGYVNRSRIDLLGGLLGAFRRWIIGARLIEGMEQNLEEARQRVNAACNPGMAPAAPAPRSLP